MKNVLLFFCVAFTISCAAQSKDVLSVRKLLADQTLAWNRGDINGFMKGYWRSDSLMFIGKSGITYGWDKTLANYKKNYPDTVAMGILAFTLITVERLSPEYFHVVGKWHLERTNGNLEGHFTLLFKKIKEEWVIVADHSS